ncbi:MAG: hypothetical protein JWL86_503 [Rhizobium sp.]|nr:hypothetical protein [Rhizobium sp.]
MSLFAAGDVAAFRAGTFAAAQTTYLSGVTFTDAFLLGQIQAAEQDVSSQLKVLLEPTVIFPYVPTDAEIAALSGKPWRDEPGYDYDPEFFRNERWGYIVSRQQPIISIEYIQFAYPSPQNLVYKIPSDWLRVDRKYGHIRMVPASSTFVAPLGAFLMQALGGGSNIPSMIQMKYTAGLNGKNDVLWPLIQDVIYKMAVLKIMQGAMIPGSVSISADGLSQSLSTKIDDYQAVIDRTLFGPKGSNGGLWTTVHGFGGGVLGVV